MPYISTEALAGAALLLVLAFGYQYIPKATTGGKKKQKRKNKKANAAPTESLDATPTLKKKSKGKGNGKDQGRTDSLPNPTRGAVETEPSHPVDHEANGAPSFATVAAGPSSSKAKPKTLAEKIAPKPRKTKVDDMLDPEDLPPTHARVMKIVNPSSAAASVPGPQSTPAPTLAPPVDAKVGKYSDDYTSDSEDVEEDDGWNVVRSKPKKPVSLSNTSSSPYTSGPPVPGGAAPLPVSTKTQRKNAKKAESKKAAKAAEEADRQRRLAMHKKDLEREKINEIYASGKKKGAGSKGTAGATIEDGRLVWD